MTAPFEGMVDTSVVSTFVRVIGEGPKVFVLHGGPGFDHRYLRSALKQLARRRTLILYDQIGCGRSSAAQTAVTGEATVRQFAELRAVIARDEPIGVFAHSWGALVAVAGAAAANSVPFAEGVFVTPMPPTRHGYEVCRNNLFRRIPAETMAEFERLATASAAGDAIVRLLLPFYVGPSQVPVPDLHIDMPTFVTAMDSLEDFDFRSGLDAVGHFDVLLGETDFTTEDLIEEMITVAGRVRVMNGVGHFPFYEDPATFDGILAEFFPY